MCKDDVKLVNNQDGKMLSSYLRRIQHELFNLGNMIATLREDFNENMPSVNEDDIEYMENKINFFNKDLPDLTSFILPGRL